MTAKTHQPGFLDWVLILAATPLIHLLGLTLRIQEKGQMEWSPRARQWSLRGQATTIHFTSFRSSLK